MHDTGCLPGRCFAQAIGTLGKHDRQSVTQRVYNNGSTSSPHEPESQEEKRQQRRMRRVARAVEPEVLARHMLLPEDDVIRAQDIPERLQAAAKFGPTVFDVDACAQCVSASSLGPASHALSFHACARLVKACCRGLQKPAHVFAPVAPLSHHVCMRQRPAWQTHTHYFSRPSRAPI